MAKTRAVQSGKIWENRSTREVLWGLMKLQKISNGILKIQSPKTKVDGEIGVNRGIYLTGARTRIGETGYAAIKKLLSVQEGSFSFVDNGVEGLGDLDQNLKVRITQVINVWPNLPERLEDLTAKNTLSRIRAIDPEAQPTEEDMVDQDVAKQLREWEEKSMGSRAIVFWSLFAVISIAVAIWIFASR